MLSTQQSWLSFQNLKVEQILPNAHSMLRIVLDLISCYLWSFSCVTEGSVATIFFLIIKLCSEYQGCEKYFCLCIFFRVRIVVSLFSFPSQVDHVRIICRDAPFLYLLWIIISCWFLLLSHTYRLITADKLIVFPF